MIKTAYILEEDDYAFELIPEKGKMLYLSVRRKPLDSKKGFPVESLRKIIIQIFEEFNDDVCETVGFGIYTFRRGGSELDFYKEVSKAVSFF